MTALAFLRPVETDDLASQSALLLADWRRRVNALYAAVRATENPEAAWCLWRDGRDDLFRRHPQSPIPADRRARYSGVPVYDYDPGLRFVVGLIPVEAPEQTWEIGPDGPLRIRAVARTDGLGDSLGQELTLFWIGGYGGGLFLPFQDATSGTETYGGGRYLLDAIKGADLGSVGDRLILDFNFAYHPSCCHSADWTCPLAPAENRLPQPARGGERLAWP